MYWSLWLLLVSSRLGRNEYSVFPETNRSSLAFTVMFVPEVFLVFAAGFAFSAAIGTWEVREM